jgi:hypothetical protein
LILATYSRVRAHMALAQLHSWAAPYMEMSSIGLAFTNLKSQA